MGGLQVGAASKGAAMTRAEAFELAEQREEAGWTGVRVLQEDSGRATIHRSGRATGRYVYSVTGTPPETFDKYAGRRFTAQGVINSKPGQN